MSKITTDHLARSAYVYVRQSTPGQVHRNHEGWLVHACLGHDLFETGLHRGMPIFSLT